MSGLFLFHFPHQDDWLPRPVIIDRFFYTVLLPVEYVASDHRKVPPGFSKQCLIAHWHCHNITVYKCQTCAFTYVFMISLKNIILSAIEPLKR